MTLPLLCGLDCGSREEGRRPSSPGADQVFPKRIISVVPNATEILFALGLGDRVVAVSAFCQSPSEVLKLPKVGDYQSILTEKVLALRPDLIIGMPTGGNRAALDQLREMGYAALWIQIDGVEDIFKSIEEIGVRTGVPERSRQLAAGIRNELTRLQQRVAGQPIRRVLFVVDRNPLIVAGRGSYIDDLLRFAGASNVAGSSPVSYPVYSLEEVIASRPEVIIDTAFNGVTGIDALAEARREWGRYPSIPAVAENRIFCTRDSSLFVPGPRVVEGLRRISEMVHPEVADRK